MFFSDRKWEFYGVYIDALLSWRVTRLRGCHGAAVRDRQVVALLHQGLAAQDPGTKKV
jgi:hypothetical protein